MGVGENVDDDLLKDEVISEPKEESYFDVEDFDQLTRIIDKLVTEACRTLQPITTTPTPAPPVGGKRIKEEKLSSILLLSHCT